MGSGDGEKVEVLLLSTFGGHYGGKEDMEARAYLCFI